MILERSCFDLFEMPVFDDVRPGDFHETFVFDNVDPISPGHDTNSDRNGFPEVWAGVAFAFVILNHEGIVAGQVGRFPSGWPAMFNQRLGNERCEIFDGPPILGNPPNSLDIGPTRHRQVPFLEPAPEPVPGQGHQGCAR